MFSVHSPRFSLLSIPYFPGFSSLSLSGCPLADKSLRSLMAAHAPELKYVCSTPSPARLICTAELCFANISLSFTAAALVAMFLLHFTQILLLSLPISVKLLHTDERTSLNSFQTNEELSFSLICRIEKSVNQIGAT